MEVRDLRRIFLPTGKRLEDRLDPPIYVCDGVRRVQLLAVQVVSDTDLDL